MHSDYRKFARENFETGLRYLASDEARDAFRSLWDAYENYLDGAQVFGANLRERNSAFEADLRPSGLHAHFLRSVLSCPEAGILADLMPRIFREELFQRSGEQRTDEHDAFTSDYERFRSGRRTKERDIPALYDFGDYPGLLAGSGGSVKGDVLRSSRLHELLDRTDEIEGDCFKRRLVWARPQRTSVEPALVWVYEYVGDVSGAIECEKGVWPRGIDDAR